MSSRFSSWGACALVITVAYLGASATTYYVSPSGSNGDGRSPAQAWQTIGDLNSHANSFVPGDSILFERGQTFIGQVNATRSGNSSHPIYYGTFGSGANPVISGAVTIEDFSAERTNVYSAPVSSTVQALHFANRSAILARKPNTGFYDIVTGSKTSVSDATNLTGATDYYTGANIRLRTSDWTFEARTISSSSGGTVQWTDDLWYAAGAGWGYYLDNHADFLDAANEWYYDATARELLVYSTQPLSGTSAFASVHDYGLKGATNVSHLVIENIAFAYQAVDGVRLYGTVNGVTISNCTFSRIERHGVGTGGTLTSVSISQCRFEHIRGTGVWFHTLSNSHIHHNHFTNIGMVQGYGATFGFPINNAVGVAIANGGSNQVHHNTLDSIGYAGIRVDGENSVIERNYVRNTLLTYSDGGALYCWGFHTTGLTFRYNVVENTIGNPDGGRGHGVIAHGIYLDNGVSNVTVENNVVIKSNSSGIFCNAGTRRSRVANNTVYDYAKHGLFFVEKVNDSSNVDNTISGNTIVALADSVYAVRKTTSAATDNYNPGTWRDNLYVNPYAALVGKSSKTGGGSHVHRELSFQAWKELVGESNSRSLFWGWHLREPVDTTGDQMIANGTFSSNTSGWTSWARGTCELTHVASSALDGGALRLAATSQGANDIALAYSQVAGGFARNQWYQLAFSVVGGQTGNVFVNPRQHSGSFSSLGVSSTFPFLTARMDYTYVFQTTENTSPARIDFQIDADDDHYVLDNVSVLPVSVEYRNPRDRVKLFYNASDERATVNLGTKTHIKLDSSTVCGSVELEPWTSVVLVPQQETCTTQMVIDRDQGGALSARVRVDYAPLSRSITVDGLEGVTDVSVFDMAGRCIARTSGQRIGQWSVPMNARAVGVYLVHVHTADGALRIQRVTTF